MLLSGHKLKSIIYHPNLDRFEDIVDIRKATSKSKGCKSCLPNPVKQKLYYLLTTNNDLKEVFFALLNTKKIYIFFAPTNEKRQLYVIE